MSRSIEISICPNCHIRVIPSADGSCPACNHHPEAFLPAPDMDSCNVEPVEIIPKIAEPVATTKVKSSGNICNPGAVLGGIGMGLVVLFLKNFGFPVLFGDVGMSFAVASATALGGYAWSMLRLPKPDAALTREIAMRAAVYTSLLAVAAYAIAIFA